MNQVVAAYLLNMQRVVPEWVPYELGDYRERPE